MTKSVAGHAVNYAIERYALSDLVTAADHERATEEMVGYLKWKLGNPSAVAAQFVSAGYQHFDRAYVDKAGAALLGFELPKENGGHSTFYLPPWFLQAWDKAERLGNIGKAYLLQSFFGIPAGLTRAVLDALQDQYYKVAKHLGFNIPKEYDFPNRLLEVAIEARRDPTRLAAEFDRALAEAKTRDTGGAAVPATPAVRPVRTR